MIHKSFRHVLSKLNFESAWCVYQWCVESMLVQFPGAELLSHVNKVAWLC